MPAIEQLLMPNTYVKLMARASPDAAAMLAGTGLEAAAVLHGDTPIRVWQQLVCARNSAAMMRRDDWHLAWVGRVAERFHGPITSAWLSAPTLGAGLDVFVDTIPTRIPYLSWRAASDDTHYRCEVRPLIELGDLAPLLLEIPLLTLVEYLKRNFVREPGAARLEFPHAALAALPYYHRRLRCQLAFGARAAAFSMPVAWRELANPGHDAPLWNAALLSCRAALREGSHAALVNDIGRLLVDSLERPGSSRVPPTLPETAAALGLSVRSLNRRLAAAATSYQVLIDDVRKEYARALLTERRRRVGEIASALGYRDQASFGRAFKRWYGVSPGRYRRSPSPE